MDRKEELIAAARSVAARLGVRRLSIAAFQRETRISKHKIYTRFQSWHALCEAAGLLPDENNRRVPEEDIFAAMRAVFLAMGGICTRSDFVSRTSIAASVLTRRFRSWNGALAAFRRWAAVNAPDFPLMDALEARLAPPPDTSPAVPAWPPRGGRACGAPLGFRAMLFAPINEAGVIALFGMVAAELGYRIETVAPGFPDCTARRHVGGGRWESVRIELEFRSHSFRDHGHDADGCDVIVCWEHDWPDCPLEVLALREAIAALPGR